MAAMVKQTGHFGEVDHMRAMATEEQVGRKVGFDPSEISTDQVQFSVLADHLGIASCCAQGKDLLVIKVKYPVAGRDS